MKNLQKDFFPGFEAPAPLPSVRCAYCGEMLGAKVSSLWSQDVEGRWICPTCFAARRDCAKKAPVIEQPEEMPDPDEDQEAFDSLCEDEKDLAPAEEDEDLNVLEDELEEVPDDFSKEKELPLARGGTDAPDAEWEERQRQKKFLRDFYPDYDPVHHDAFVLMFNKGIEAARLNEYEKARGIADQPEIKPGDLVRFTPYCRMPFVQEGIVGEVITGSSGEIGYHVGLKDNGGIVRIWPSQGKIELLEAWTTKDFWTPPVLEELGELMKSEGYSPGAIEEALAVLDPPASPVVGPEENKIVIEETQESYLLATSDSFLTRIVPGPPAVGEGETFTKESDQVKLVPSLEDLPDTDKDASLELAIREIETQPEIEPIPEAFARSAFSWNSMDPEKRGRQVCREYEETLREDWRNLFAHATTPEKLATLQEEFARYLKGYRTRYMKWLSSLSRCASAFVTGPSNFPTRRMEKRNDIEHRRSVEYLEYRSRALDAIEKALHPELRPIMAGDSDACARLREKIAKAEEYQEKMRAVNKCVKRKKGGPDLEGLRAMGFSEKTIERLLEKDELGRTGYPDYELSRNTANIRRMKQRLEKIERDQAAEFTSQQGTEALLEDCPAENRVKLFFPGKPSAEVREKLKRNGFRWTPSLGCWQAYRNWNSAQAAKEIAGVKEERTDAVPKENG